MKANEIRIIGGSWRSRRIRFPTRAGLRPTPDRVRETVFNWLGQDLTGRACLDLYSGSGALGFEAASRGAARVVMVEQDAIAFDALSATRAELPAPQVELIRADALEFLRRDRGCYDVVFLDPPFAAGNWAKILPGLAPRLARDALVYCESGTEIEIPAGWECWKHGRAGQVTYQLLKWARHEPQGGVPGDIRSDHPGP
jgi:16S rRNA (guanine966-N2)-methyltransferase